MKVTALFVSAFVAASLGMPLETLVQHERRSDAHGGAGMVKLRAAEPSAAVPVRIALAQRNLDRGMELLLAVADPDSPTYGRHYTQQQVADTFAPTQESIDAVRQWLVSAGIPDRNVQLSQNRGFLDFETTVGGLEALLQTSYHVYEDKRTASQHLGADDYHLPASIAAHVDYVWPAVASRRVKSAPAAAVSPKDGTGSLTPEEIKAIKADPLTDCTKYVTPACIAAMYNIPPAPRTVSPKNALGVFEIDYEMYKQSDLDLFYETVAPDIPKGTGPKVDLIDLASAPSPDQAGGEAAMDFDMAIPIIYPQATELYQVKEGFHQFLEAVDSSYCDKGTSDDCGTFTPTTVISFSWGGEEDPRTVPETKAS
ncbi:Peptidase S53, propeptide [Cordyceps fumosorosea ARSEF 2679]|uniref:Peptidase S53, propeptide n=1 Tax=Cordyceps fumosorosea (strain ARSEF 2679) TaxID=1081104 RepID=A0A168ELM9_CORFA|nr:Peptidase S53, propeptide [Cordyceps fumosorosea ARSEF 2679]OAA73958.1 Peptidase S53, propeptide [Cordyceps fumosorosea ARSEF 2679]